MPNSWFLNAPLLPVLDFHKFLNLMFVHKPQVGQWLKNSKIDGNCAMQCVATCINESIQWFEVLRIFQKMGVIWFIIPPLHYNFAWCTFFHFRGENLHLDLDGILFLGGVRTTMYGNLPSQIVSKHGYKASILIICLHFYKFREWIIVVFCFCFCFFEYDKFFCMESECCSIFVSVLWENVSIVISNFAKC